MRMKNMDYQRIAVTTTGGAGVSAGTATGDIIFRGKLHAVYLDYHASAPATTDVTISIASPVGATLLTVTDNVTDGWYLPRNGTCDNAGAARLYAAGGTAVAEAMPVCGKITVAVAQSNDLTDCVVAHVFVEQ